MVVIVIRRVGSGYTIFYCIFRAHQGFYTKEKHGQASTSSYSNQCQAYGQMAWATQPRYSRRGDQLKDLFKIGVNVNDF